MSSETKKTGPVVNYFRKMATYKWTLRLTVLTPFLALTCLLLMGGGHGWYTPAFVFFPSATFNIVWQDHLSGVLFAAGTFQFILYGLLIDLSRPKNRQALAVTAILVSHVALVMISLLLKSGSWR